MFVNLITIQMDRFGGNLQHHIEAALLDNLS